MNAEVDRLLALQDPRIAMLARTLYKRILAAFPDAVVTVDGCDIGFGTGTGHEGRVFTVSPHRTHLTLGIAGGADLPDPDGLLEGTGEGDPRVRIHSAEDLDRPALTELMAARLAAAKA